MNLKILLKIIFLLLLGIFVSCKSEHKKGVKVTNNDQKSYIVQNTNIDGKEYTVLFTEDGYEILAKSDSLNIIFYYAKCDKNSSHHYSVSQVRDVAIRIEAESATNRIRSIVSMKSGFFVDYNKDSLMTISIFGNDESYVTRQIPINVYEQQVVNDCSNVYSRFHAELFKEIIGHSLKIYKMIELRKIDGCDVLSDIIESMQNCQQREACSVDSVYNNDTKTCLTKLSHCVKDLDGIHNEFMLGIKSE